MNSDRNIVLPDIFHRHLNTPDKLDDFLNFNLIAHNSDARTKKFLIEILSIFLLEIFRKSTQNINFYKLSNTSQ